MTIRSVGALAAMALLGACAHEASTSGEQESFKDAARAPFEDVGLVKPEAPAKLAGIVNPYDPKGLSACTDIARELAMLDDLLGRENYTAETARETKSDLAHGVAVSAAEDAATGFIPFRSWVRRASGASKAEQAVALAIEKGRARRAFLRGYGMARACPDMAVKPPPTATNAY